MNAPFVTAPKPRNGTTSAAPAPTRPPVPAPRRDHCFPHELPDVLDWFSGIRVLSLDCFDTLLWRDCHAPTDLFSVLPDINPSQRVHGEHRARLRARRARGA